MTSSTSYTIPNHHEPPSSNPSAYHTPLLLVPLPRRSGDDNKAADILAYGGDDGCIYLLPAPGQQEPPRVIRQYDDCVRALAVSPDGKRVAVGFDDGSTMIYRYDDDDNSGEGRHAFIPKAESNSQSLSQFDSDDLDDDCFAGPRLLSPIRQMAFDPRSSRAYFLAIVSEDGDSPLVVCDATSAETASKLYLADDSAQEHNGGGARSLAYALPSADAKPLLATLGMDGHFLVWNVATSPLADPSLDWEFLHRDALAVVGVDPGEGMGSDAADRACRVVWGDVEGRAVCLLPGKTDVQYRYGEEASVLQRQKFLMEGGHKDTIVTMAWEPRGKRFVTGGRDGKIFLWEMAIENNEILGQLVGELPIQKGDCVGIPPITSIVWTEESFIYVADASGAVYVVTANDGDLKSDKNKVDTKAAEDVDESNKLATQSKEVEKAPQKESGLRRLNKKAVDDVSDDDDAMFDEDAKESTNEDQTARDRMKTDVSKFIEDEAEDAADDDEATVDVHASNVETHPTSPAKDDTMYDDIDTNLMPQDNTDPEEDMFQTHQDPVDLGQDYANHQTTPSFPPLQPAFAPSSTPINEPRRILCWNHIGVVTTYPDPDSQYNLVDVAFHETAGLVGGRRPINFTDNLGFIVGTLGEEGALFASDLMEDDDDDDDLDDEEFHDLGVMSEAARKAVKLSRRKKKREDSGKGSQVYFNRFETFGRNADKDWVVALPDGERVMGCAAGRGWCSVITSRRYLRLFTTAGIQGPVIWLPGEPVTIIGRNRFVAVVYHRSATPMQDGTQLLGYFIIDGMKGTTVACGDVSAMSPGASLTWAGFTEVCALSVMDSEGVLSMLARQSPTDPGGIDGNWVPMLDTVGHRKSTNDRYWPVEVHGGKLVCVLLRGGKEYPDAGRRPVTTTLSLRMPLAAGLTKCGQVEELSIRGKIALEQKKVLNDYNTAHGEGNANDAEDEYIQLSAQIVSPYKQVKALSSVFLF
eukprot:CCRYP_001865-RA/>CCRYP_001865-RA protein AED:0.05 eAED:0.05 QI:78/1/1/1/1/0.75/4/1399/978